MPARKRQCSNCRHYEDAGHSRNGWCTHPDRKTTSGAKLLVRGGELACRNPWGTDLFESRDGNDQSRDPAPPAPPPGTPPSLTDDRVTSVITPPTRGVDAGGEDRVVSDRPAPRRDDDPNGAALREQAERARIMSRGSGPAIASARQRHLDRQRGERPDDDPDAAPVDPAQTDGAPPRAALLPIEPRDAVVSQRDRMDRRVSASGSAGVIGIDQPVPRSEVRQRLPDLASDPRYTSVPDIDPDFDLPLNGQDAGSLDVAIVSPDGDPEIPGLTAGPTVEPAPTSYEHVWQRARRSREAKHHVRPIRTRPMLATQRGATPTGDDVRVVESRRPVIDPVDPWQAQVEPAEMDDPSDLAQDRFDRLAEHGRGALDEAQDEVIEADSLPPRIEVAPVQRHRNWFRTFGRRRIDPEDDRSGREDEGPWNSAPRRTRPTIHAESVVVPDDDDLWLEDDDQPLAAEVDAAHWDHAEDDWRSADERSRVTRERHAAWDDDVPDDPDLTPVTADRYVEPDRRFRHIPDQAPSDIGGSVLPDLDDLLATAMPRRVEADAPDEREVYTTEHREPTPAPVPMEESRAGRWMSQSPSTSALRASNFRDWPGGGPIRTADRAQSGDAIAELVEDVALPLPDLDSDRFDLRELVERGGELLDMHIDVAREVPRECRTCRSFHSADGGARGWCTNPWAFTHRRMVNEDDLACESTIGCWWLPANRFWMLEDGSSSGNATPLMDAFMARISARPEREISTS